MSIRVMSLVWDGFSQGGSPKLVMLAMADWCNDEGGSLHPSISSISKKVCVSEKQARRIVHDLIDQGYLSVIGNENGGNPGDSRQYILNIKMLLTPPASVTPPVDVTPPAGVHIPLPPVSLTPPAGVPDPSHGREPNHQEPPLTTMGTTNKACAMLEGMGVSKTVAADFVLLRKQKKAAITQTALDGIKREADLAGYTMDDAVRIICERGWIGFKAEWVKKISVGNETTNDQAREGARRRLFGESKHATA